MLTWPASMMFGLPVLAVAAAGREGERGSGRWRQQPRAGEPPDPLAPGQGTKGLPALLSRSVGPQRDEGRLEDESSVHAGGSTASRSAGGTGSTSRSSTRPAPKISSSSTPIGIRQNGTRHRAAEPVEQRLDALDREVAAARLQPVGRRVTRRQHEPSARPEHAAHLATAGPSRLSMWWYTSGITAPSNDASSSIVSGRSRSCWMQLDVGADPGTCRREQLGRSRRRRRPRHPAAQLGEVEAGAASELGEPQPARRRRRGRAPWDGRSARCRSRPRPVASNHSTSRRRRRPRRRSTTAWLGLPASIASASCARVAGRVGSRGEEVGAEVEDRVAVDLVVDVRGARSPRGALGRRASTSSQ